jgi:hypothetical protein
MPFAVSQHGNADNRSVVVHVLWNTTESRVEGSAGELGSLLVARVREVLIHGKNLTAVPMHERRLPPRTPRYEDMVVHRVFEDTLAENVEIGRAHV